MNATGKASLLSIPVKISDSMIPLRTERPANKSQVEISAFGSSKKATQKQAAEHLKIETAANQMV